RVVNRRLAAVDGVPAADHVGRRPGEVSQGGPVDDECVARVLRTGSPDRTSAAAIDSSGAERYLVTSYYPACEESGRVTTVGAMTLDVTDQESSRRRAEQLLHFAGLVGAVATFDALASALVHFFSTTFRARCAVGEVGDDRVHIAAVQGFVP